MTILGLKRHLREKATKIKMYNYKSPLHGQKGLKKLQGVFEIGPTVKIPNIKRITPMKC